MIKEPRVKMRPVSTATLRYEDARLAIALLAGPHGFNTQVRFLRAGAPSQRGMRLETPIPDEATARARYEGLIEQATSKGWLRRAAQKRVVNQFTEIPSPPVAPTGASDGQ